MHGHRRHWLLWGILGLLCCSAVTYAAVERDVRMLHLLAGERNATSATNGYLVNRPEVNGSVVSAGITAKTISAAPAHFAGVWIHTALVGTFTVTCLTDEAGTAANWVLPVGTVGLLAAPFSRCETSLTVQKSSATDDGRIIVFWRPL